MLKFCLVYIIGILLGIFTLHFAIALKTFADVFVKFIKLMIVPIIFLTLVFRSNE